MKRSALMLLAGLVAGLIIGLSFSHSHRDERNVSASAAVGSTVAVSSPHVRPSMSSSDQREIVLGDILTVPFQELYAVLSTLPPERLANLAGELRKLPPGSQTNNKIAAFFKAWAHFDPMSALQAAALFKTTEGKNFAVQGIIESADTAQIEALAKTIRDWPPDAVTREQRNSFLASALMKWAPLDPAAAAKFFDTTQVGSLQFNPTASIIAQNWAAMDSQAAMSWAQAHANGQNFNSALNGALTGWWQKDHAAAEGYAATHLSTLQDRQIASTLAANIYNSDPARAKDWVSHLSDAEARLQATHMLAITMSFNDPKAAGDWAVTLPSDMRETVLHTAVAQWAASDLTAAGEWIKTQDGPIRDEATDGYIPTLLAHDPATAAAWAMSISDAAIRNKSLDRVASDWLGKNAPAATAWIQSSGLSDDQKRRLLALAPKG